MDLTIFMIGTGVFGAGFFLLLFCLLQKRKLVFPFTLMGLGVILCFVGLVLSAPLTEEEMQQAAGTLKQCAAPFQTL